MLSVSASANNNPLTNEIPRSRLSDRASRFLLINRLAYVCTSDSSRRFCIRAETNLARTFCQDSTQCMD
jgi:hypothetical protein